MNIQQFQYILAISETRHFELAAKKCFITQSTLSTMVSRFEQEIGIIIFDRKKKPVELTNEGAAVIEQLKVISKEIAHLQELAKEIKGEVTGNLTISVIPTIAPYLLPLFLQGFAARFPNLNIEIKEQTTDEIIRQLKSRELDIGIISIPVGDRDIIELKLYDEPFVFFDAGNICEQPASIKKLNVNRLYLLEEGHCLRTQVIKLCNLHKKRFRHNLNFEYKAGSIHSLVRFVKANRATTLLPYLATLELTEEDSRHVSRFDKPVPYRTVGIVVHRHFVKKKILEMLQKDILDKVSKVLPQKKDVVGKKLFPV